MTEEFNNNNKTGNTGLILSVVAIIGLIVLYIIHFTNVEEPAKEQRVQKMPALPSGSNSIVFVNSDVLLQEYDLVKKLTENLDNDRKKKDADFSAKQKAYEDDAAYFQQQVQKQSISEQSAQQIYEQLMMTQQELVQLQDKYSAELAQKEYEMNVILLDSVRNYLTRMNDIYNFDYILSYNTAGNIFLAKDTFDITPQVLEGLNSEYKKKYMPEE
ncbi:MAG: hypothetical protein B6D61_02035 [Bacteroidetes bacterium 4484_249]|nr:MAG: hypothetical protein B6D61_02035 [Bacteroidetes bacterium 4484_249]